MKKILIVFTGGTIGSKINNAVIDVDISTGYHLIDLFYKNSEINIEFETIQPLNILSENCTPAHWEELYNAISEKEMSEYAGIIVTHGTDTLPYTSALIGYLFNNIKIPLVFTASNCALNTLKSNGLRNFISAVQFINDYGIPGVFTIYENNNNEMIVYLSTRLIEADPYNDQFKSFGNTDLGSMKDGTFTFYDNKLNPSEKEFSLDRVSYKLNRIKFDNEIIAIKPYPGLNYDHYDLSINKPKAILHNLYHSATACINDGKYSLPSFIKKCKDDGIDFFLTSFKTTDEDLYITSRELLENGAIPLRNISFEAAVAKLWIAYNQNAVRPVEYMKQELYFEFLKW